MLIINAETSPKIVQETQDLFTNYNDNPARQAWAIQFQEDSEFRLGNQWTQKAADELELRGQAPIVVNCIHPAVETAKALLTSRKPGVRASGREDSDTKVAKMFNGLFEYIWDISEGNTAFRNIVDNYYVGGLGYGLVYQDPLADNGKGEVKWMTLDPLEVYVDPNSRHRLFDDAENILISRLYTRAQAIKYKPLYEDVFNKMSADGQTERPITDSVATDALSFPETPGIIDNMDEEYLRCIERYQMVLTNKFRIFEAFSKHESILSEEAFMEYLKKPAWIINGQMILTDRKKVQMTMQQIMQQTGKQPQVKPVTHQELIRLGMIRTVAVRTKNIRVTSIMGDELLYVRELPSDLHCYPIVAFPNLHTGTPFPTSDVRMARPSQEYVNKVRSLIIAHAATSTNVKVLLPKGSVDIETFERNWARPGVGIEVDYDFGEPKPVPPVPLPNELYHNEQVAKNDIKQQFGIYDMMQGDTSAAPNTYKATISLDEFGQRKIRSKLADIEGSLTRMGNVMIPFIQQLYTKEKTFRIIQPNNDVTEYAINKRLLNDKTKEIETINDISQGHYDIRVLVGSTLPNNRYAELELHKEMYSAGIIDRQEVLKKTDIYDKEGILQRTDIVEQLKGQIGQLNKTVKKQSGDLQTAEREVMHAKRETELTKFKASLQGVETETKAAKVIYEEGLKSSQREFEKDNKRRIKDNPNKES